MPATPSNSTIDIAARISAMPKAEIHIHLEGATSAETYFEIAKRNGVALAVDSLPQWRQFFKYDDFDHFIDVYVTSTKVLRTPDDYELLVRRFGEQQARANVRYTETFVSCSLRSNALDDSLFLDALTRGRDGVEREHGIRIAFIADISREIPGSAERVVDLAIEGKRRGVFIGLGLGGPEIGFPPEMFANAYARARAADLHVVAHAGETGGARSVSGALDALAAERIGHGVQSLEDPALIERLRLSQVPLEICPQSNYRLGVVRPGEPHPVRALVDSGVRCTVNSDDPAMFETSLVKEYETLAEQGFAWPELWQLNLNTLDSAFLSMADKKALHQEWKRFADGAGQY